MSNDDNRLEVLTEFEIDELYSIPHFTEEQRADYFSLNDLEKDLCTDRIDPLHKAYSALLLGYLKYKPVIKTLDVDKIKDDLDLIRKRDTLHMKLPRTPLDSYQKSRIYSAVFAITGHSFYDEKEHKLCNFISQVSQEVTYPKEIFDRCIGFIRLVVELMRSTRALWVGPQTPLFIVADGFDMASGFPTITLHTKYSGKLSVIIAS